MASVQKADIPEISNFFSEFWMFVKSVWKTEKSDEYWDDVTGKANELIKKYPDNFCKGQILAFLDYLDKKERGK